MDIAKLEYQDALRRYPTDVLFLSWPPKNPSRVLLPGEQALSKAGHALERFLGKYVIYIGELPTTLGIGCTADELFFDNIKKHWQILKKYDIPQWPGIYDTLVIYVRKNVCQHCLKETSLKRCSRCKSIGYCSVDCQRADWMTHREICQGR
jgi:hypothetical protein